MLRRAVAAFRAARRGVADVVAAGRGGRDRGELGRVRVGDEVLNGRGAGSVGVPGVAGYGGHPAPAAGDGRLPRRVPPAARAADLGGAPQAAGRDTVAVGGGTG